MHGLCHKPGEEEGLVINLTPTRRANERNGDVGHAKPFQYDIDIEKKKILKKIKENKKSPHTPSSSNPANKSRCKPIPPPNGEDASAELLPSSNHPHCLEPSMIHSLVTQAS